VVESLDEGLLSVIADGVYKRIRLSSRGVDHCRLPLQISRLAGE
jgi:hypothetical protein